MSPELKVFVVCLSVSIIWFFGGGHITNKLKDPTNCKQVFFIMALLGPLGVILMFIMFIDYWIKAIYKKLAQ